MASKHTPGPWEFTVDQRGNGAIGAPHPELGSILIAGLPHIAVEFEANGRLIATAPDMLAALHHIAGLLANHPSNDAKAARDHARMVIAKAEAASNA